MEPKPITQYKIAEPLVIACPGCDRTIGEVTLVAGQEWLLLDGVVVRTMHGACSICGAEIHYSASDRMLSGLIWETIHLRNAIIP